MGLGSNELPNLINGVSQQAEDLRFPSQVTEQINATSSPVDGLTKRAPTENVVKMLSSAYDGTEFFHAFNRPKTSEQSLIVVRGGVSPEIEAFDVQTGASIPVVNGDGGGALSASDKVYLQTADSRSDLRAVTVGDNILIVNRSVTAAMDGTSASPTKTPEALVFARTIRESSAVNVSLYNDLGGALSYSGSYTPVSGDDQDDVIEGLKAALDAAGANGPYTYSTKEGVMYVTKDDNSEFDIHVSSNLPGGTYGLKDTTPSLTDLPEKGFVGFSIEIQGSADSEDTSYFVTYKDTTDSRTTGFFEGFYQETVGPAVLQDFDEATMPYKLVSTGSTFEFSPVDWESREVGDSTTNPAPSFINSTINDIFFFENRLGMLSGENVVLSEISNFFDFFQPSIVNLLDDAPIDISAATEEVINLDSALQREGELLVFSDQSQFILDSEAELTPKTVKMTQVSKASAEFTTKPVALNNLVYFPFDRDQFAGLTEYLRADQFEPFQSFDITNHVPRYIEGDIEHIAGLPSQNTLIIIADGFTTGFYVYNFFDKKGERVQSAWSKYDFGNQVHFAVFFGTKLYIVVDREDGPFLERIEFSFGAKDTDSNIKMMIDRRIDESDVTSLAFDSVENKTTFTLPHLLDSGSTIQVSGRSTSGNLRDYAIPNASFSGTTVTIANGDFTALPMYIGQQYEMSQELTRPVLRIQDKPIYDAKYKIRNANITYNDSSSFKVEIAAQAKDTYTYTFSADCIDTFDSSLGISPPLQDGVFIVPVMEDAKLFTMTIKNDTPVSSTLLSVNWEGWAYNRSRPV